MLKIPWRRMQPRPWLRWGIPGLQCSWPFTSLTAEVSEQLIEFYLDFVINSIRLIILLQFMSCLIHKIQNMK